MEFLKSVDTWFLILVVVLLGGFFLWAVKYLFDGIKQSIIDLGNSFKESIGELKELVKELYNHRNDHEIRIVRIETRCGACPDNMHREGLGRREGDK